MEVSLFTVNGVVTATPLNNTLVASVNGAGDGNGCAAGYGPWLGARPVTVGGGGTALAAPEWPAKNTITNVHGRQACSRIVRLVYQCFFNP